MALDRSSLSTQEQAIYDQFYENGSCVIDGCQITDIKTNMGNVQIDFKNGTHSFSVNYNPTNPDSLTKNLTFLPGDGGIGAVGVNGYQTGNLTSYYLDGGNSDYTAITYDSPYHHETTDKAVVDVLNVITDGKASSVRQVVAGASAGSVGTVDVIRSIYSQYSGSDKPPVDIMLLDGKGDAMNGLTPCMPFVKAVLSDTEVKNGLVSSGSIVYAYESNGGLTGGPENAVAALKTASSAGLNVLMVVNDGLGEHAGKFSPEVQLSNGEVSKVFSDFYGVKATAQSLSTGSSGLNKYYLIDANQTDGIRRDGAGNKIEISDYEVNKYLNSQREAVNQRKTEIVTDRRITTEADTDDEQTTDSDTSSSSSTGSSKGTSVDSTKISVTYQSVVDNANKVIDLINGTSFFNKSIDYQFCESTTTFPESLNNGNTFLYETSSNLLSNISHDVNNIEQMLKNFSYLDSHTLYDAASKLGPENNYGLFVLPKLEFTSSYIKDFTDPSKKYMTLFTDQVKERSAGAIHMKDINNILSGGKLIGVLGEGLQSEINDATALRTQINNLLENSQIESSAWTLMQDRLSEYSNMCTLRIEAANTLNDAYVKALQMVADYMSPDESLDDGDIPALEAENAALEAVPESIYVGEDEFGNPVYEHNPAYDEAQAQIAVNNAKIAKLEGLATVLNNANQVIADAIDQVNSSYATPVNNVSQVFVPSIGGSSGYYA